MSDSDGGIIQSIVNLKLMVYGFIYGKNTPYDKLLNAIEKVESASSKSNNIDQLKEINKNLNKINANILESNKAILQEFRIMNSQLNTIIKNNQYGPLKPTSEIISFKDSYRKN